MKKTSIAIVLAFAATAAGSAGAAGHQDLEGSDTLEFVMRSIIQQCHTSAGGYGSADGNNDNTVAPGVPNRLELQVLAGGSGAGEDALERDSGERSAAGLFQQVAHMSRALDGAACVQGANQGPNPPPAVFDPDQAVVGVDKILVLGGNCDDNSGDTGNSAGDDPTETVGGVDQDDLPNVECPAVNGVERECKNNVCAASCTTNADCTFIYAAGAKGGAELSCVDGYCAVPGDSLSAALDSGDGNPDVWASKLRLLFFGIDDAAYTLSDANSDGTVDFRDVGSANLTAPVVDCGSAARRTAASSLNLYHLYRRDDASGTTAVFKQLLGVPANQPFCNAPGVTTAPNNATSANEKYDADPIRVPCDQNEDVCSCDGTLGLLLPISVPAVSASFPTTQLYPNVPCQSGAFDVRFGSGGNPENDSTGSAMAVNPQYDWDKNANGTVVTDERFCTFGHSRLVGGCLYPSASVANSGSAACMFTNKADPAPLNPLLSALLNAGDTGTGRRCPAPNATTPTGTGPDERAFNLDVRVDVSGDNAGGNDELTLGANSGQDWQGHAFYRIHTWDGSDSAPAGACAPTGDGGNCFNAMTVVGCQKLDATEQIGCLVARDAAHMNRSLGFAGLQAVTLASVPPAPVVAGYAFPVSEVPNAVPLDGVGFKPATLTDYRFTRKLYVNSLIGFENVVNNKYPTANAANDRGDEADFASCLLTENLSTALTSNGFEATPTGRATLTGAAEATEPAGWVRDTTAPACGPGFPVP